MFFNALIFTAKVTSQTTSHNFEDGKELAFKVNCFSRFIIIAISVSPINCFYIVHSISQVQRWIPMCGILRLNLAFLDYCVFPARIEIFSKRGLSAFFVVVVFHSTKYTVRQKGSKSSTNIY